MSKLRKKILLWLMIGIMAVSAFGCAKSPESEPTAEPTSAATEEPTTAPTDEPTAATDEPKATIEPEENEYQSEILSEKSYNLNLYGDIANPDAVHETTKWNGAERPMGQTETCAWQFIATTTLTQMDISTATYEGTDVSVIFSVYKWDGSFDSTILDEPVFTQTKTGIKDNQSIRFRFKDDPLPAGEYLFVLSQPSSSFTVWTIPYTEAAEYPYVRFFTNGKIQTGVIPQVKIRYGNTPAVPLMEITD